MAHFYGQVRGAARTSATRVGHRNTGIAVEAASWSISARVELSSEDGVDVMNVSVYRGNCISSSFKKVLDKQYRSDMIMFSEGGGI